MENITRIGKFPSQTFLSQHTSSFGFDSSRPSGSGLEPVPKVSNSTPGGRRTSIAGAYRWGPPASNTTGFRPAERRTWNINAKRWCTHWVLYLLYEYMLEVGQKNKSTIPLLQDHCGSVDGSLVVSEARGLEKNALRFRSMICKWA